MPETIVNSEPSLQKLLGTMREAWKQHRYLKVQWKEGKKRSLDQNALTHVWYAQIARELGDCTAEEVRCQCKLELGVPILRTDDEDFRQRYDRLVKGRFSHEEKLDLMRWFPVTSLMTKPQLSQYLQEVYDRYRRQGVGLEWPQDEEALQ
ncbi:hypothetical protein [Algiphilus aromaticivorans]|uniref:hypothetical protein n=1 Tax=Algiphilus aromaticivorans TaxID=382454 RepID=UPI0005C159DA|nr:hypothetical protein [Algiphilus aromaticivorans]